MRAIVGSSRQHVLLVLLVIYGASTLIHFGVFGWLLVARGHLISGLVFLAAYAAGGLDSLGHYLLAPLSEHTVTMNSTILLKVTCAGLLLVEVMRQFARIARRSN